MGGQNTQRRPIKHEQHVQPAHGRIAFAETGFTPDPERFAHGILRIDIDADLQPRLAKSEGGETFGL